MDLVSKVGRAESQVVSGHGDKFEREGGRKGS